MTTADGYRWANRNDTPVLSHAYLAPQVESWIAELEPEHVLDVGCGDGQLTARIASAGFTISGLESSPSGVERARSRFPGIPFLQHDLLEPLPEAHHQAYDVVIAIEVVEHLFLPRNLFARAREALLPGGSLIVTTPYHGYVKNVALAMTGKLESHFTVGWDYGHIKFFSRGSLGAMAREYEFTEEQFARVGRIPIVAASMAVRYGVPSNSN